ncbi:N-6 DNA methylase [Actinocorallia sp. A-T 12471]|uniref:N-6 DNA methylase n=1 Tax=Actinocorallia sp. A-T 12471 TaxID=3089813 RepID=UPI0029D2995A|nr:N-6 DNA methylase [Actinocorallia sp. A-T 12471]MDX6743046.1 N-6 DNA methylase [Actinocorallia sp. A-T 12471]
MDASDAELVTMAEIARRCGVQRGAVSNWRRRHPGFPAPADVGQGRELFHAGEVARWLDGRGIDRGSRRPEEPEGRTYGDRFRAATGTEVRPRRDEVKAEPELSVSALQIVGAAERSGIARYSGLILELVRLRFQEPRRWQALARDGAAWAEQGRGTGSAADLGLWPGADTPVYLARVVELLNRLPELQGRALAEFTDGLLDRLMAHSVRGGDFYTPRELARLMVAVTEPRPGETVQDSCCGMGELLVAAAEAADVRLRARTRAKETCEATLVNLRLHGLEARVTADADDGLTTKELREPFDVMLANPPFTITFDGTGEPRLGVPKGQSLIYGWLRMAAEELGPGRRAAVVAPPAAAWSRRSVDRRVREDLVVSGLVERVIALPAGLFAATSVPVHLWVLRQGSRGVLVVDGSDLGTMVDRSRRRLSAAEVAELASTRGPRVRRMTVADLREREFELDPVRLVGRRASSGDGGLPEDMIPVLRAAEREAAEADRAAAEQLRRVGRWTS